MGIIYKYIRFWTEIGVKLQLEPKSNLTITEYDLEENEKNNEQNE